MFDGIDLLGLPFPVHLDGGDFGTFVASMSREAAEKDRRTLNMVRAMDEEGFGNCTVMGSCEAVCPKSIPISNIARMTREYVRSLLTAGK
jgi:succinate dehydrogenase / fumarate reductase iron-sulfur subunit